MGISKYYYNPETCQYEPLKLTVWTILGYGTGILAFGGLVFAALLAIADSLVESDYERALKLENQAMGKYRVILTSRLEEVEQSLDYLHRKDLEISKKLFETSTEDLGESTMIRRTHADVLKSSFKDFKARLFNLTTSTKRLQQNAVRTNTYFGRHYTLSSENRNLMQMMPTLPPVSELNLDLVVSGFGTRINPFHKGNYEHPGLDIAAPRGTGVVAAGPGKVVLVKHSSLQAGYGTYIEVDHGKGFVTRYAHLEDTQVKWGESVIKGQVIGTIGNSGGSIAPHLHYEILMNGENVDPLLFMIEGLSSHEYNRLQKICHTLNQSLD